MQRERLLLLNLSAINFTHIVDFMIIMPLGPQLMRMFTISPQQFSALVTAYMIASGIAAFLGAFVLDRFDRKKCLLVTLAGITLSTFWCALANSYEQLLLARLVAGAFGGILTVLIYSIIGDVVPFERRATAMGLVMAAFSVASVAGVPLGIFIASHISWHAPFYAVAALAALLFAPTIVLIPTLKGHVRHDESHPGPALVIGRVARDSNQRTALLFAGMLTLGHFTVVPFVAPYMVANVGFAESDLSYIYLFGGAITMISSPLVGRWADRAGKQKVFGVFAVLTAIPLFTITHLSATALPLALAITTVFFLTSHSRWVPASTLLTAAVAPQHRGAFLSFSSSIQSLMAGIAAAISGAVLARSSDGHILRFDWVGYFAIAMSLASLLVARRLRAVS